MHTTSVAHVTDKKSIRSLFITHPKITLVGYWWFLPPSMGEASYTVFQVNARPAVEEHAASFAAGHGGQVTRAQINGQGVTTFKVVLPLPTGDQAADDYVSIGQELFESLMNVFDNEG